MPAVFGLAVATAEEVGEIEVPVHVYVNGAVPPVTFAVKETLEPVPAHHVVAPPALIETLKLDAKTFT